MSGVTPRKNSWALGLFVHSDVDESDLTVYEFRVYAHLCRRAGDERRVWEGQKKIAAICGISRPQVQRALYGLRDKGWLQLVERFRDDGSQATNDIVLLGPPASDRGTPRLSERHPPPLTEAPPASDRGTISKSIEVNPREGKKKGAENRRASPGPQSVADAADLTSPPDGGAADAAGEGAPSSSQVESQSPVAKKNHAATTKKVPGGGAARRGAAEDVPIPASLMALGGFAEAWADWLAHRRSQRLSMTPLVLRRQLQKLAAHPDPVSVLNYSLDNGYQGLFFDERSPRPRSSQDANARAVQTAQAVYNALQEDTDVPF